MESLSKTEKLKVVKTVITRFNVGGAKQAAKHAKAPNYSITTLTSRAY